MEKPISRQEFLQRTAMASVALMLSSLTSFAESRKEKIRIGVGPLYDQALTR